MHYSLETEESNMLYCPTDRDDCLLMLTLPRAILKNFGIPFTDECLRMKIVLKVTWTLHYRANEFLQRVLSRLHTKESSRTKRYIASTLAWSIRIL